MKDDFFDKEICICAAIIDGSGNIWRGHRHADCIATAQAENSGSLLSMKQGFITSRNRFVSREEGYQLQVTAGILSADPGGYRGKRLWSEDLY